MHNAEKPNPPASVRDTGGLGGLSVSSKARARNSLRAVAPQSAPSGEVHGEGIEWYAFSSLALQACEGSWHPRLALPYRHEAASIPAGDGIPRSLFRVAGSSPTFRSTRINLRSPRTLIPCSASLKIT